MRISGFGLLCMGALFAPMASAVPPSGQTFTGGGAISISSGDTSTHTSTLNVSGATGTTVKTVVIELLGVTSSGQDCCFSVQGTQWMLKSPSGQEFAFLGFTGDGIDGANVNGNNPGNGLQGLNIIVQDGASPAPDGTGSATCSDAGAACWPATGTATVEPSSYFGYPTNGIPALPGGADPAAWPQYDSCSPDNFTSGCAGNTMNGALDGATADGTWTLYMNDDIGDPVSIAGWTLTLTYSTAAGTTTTVGSSAANPVFYPNSSASVSVTFTATVSSGSSGQPTGTVAFTANGTTIAGCGAVALSGAGANSSTASCTTSLAQGYNGILAAYSPTGGFGQSSGSMTQLVEVTAQQSGNTWCNNSLIPIPSGSTPLAYPVIIGVSGYAAGTTVANVSVELEGVTSPSVANHGGGISSTQFLLVAPGSGGQNLDFLDAVFTGQPPTSPINLTLFDTAGQSLTPYEDVLPFSGSFTATDDHEQGESDSFPPLQSPHIDSNIPPVPGPINGFINSNVNYAQPYGGVNALDFEQAFSGAPANGKWALYINTAEAASVNSGWCITLTVNTGVPSTTTVVSSQQQATTGQAVTFTATVKDANGPVTSGTVTFDDNGATPAGTVSGNNVVSLNGNGQATFTTGSLVEGDHKITATFAGTSSDNTSFGSIWQREDNASTVANVNGTVQFCNTGGVTSPQAANGAFTPNPSNIFVANLPGTINSVTLTLDSFSIFTDLQYGVESLLVGPGAALDFFSLTGNSPSPSTGNYTFADSAGGGVSTLTIEPGTYKPTADDSTADTFFADSGGFYTLPGSFQYAPTHGSATFGSVFGSSLPNGTWSLYFNQFESGSATGATGGWCLNFTGNPVTVDATTESTDSFTQGQQNDQLTLNIKNNGTGPTGDPTGSNPLTVTDTLNSAFTFVSSDGTGWSCGASGQTVTCTNHSAIAQGDSYPALTLNVNVSASATPGQVSNTFNVTGGAGVTATSSNTDTVTIQPAPKLAVQKTHPGTFTQGSTAEWDISVTNTASGGATAGQVTVSDTLPSGYTVANFGTTSSSWTCGGTTTVNCTATLSVSGGSGFPLIEVIVNVPANSPTSVSNTALAWGGGDLTHTNSGNAASGTDSNVPVVQVATHYSVTAPSAATAGSAFSVTVTALDAGNNTVTRYTGTVHFTSSDAAAALPADFTFTSAANGTGTFSATLNTAGNRTITATDTAKSSITGTASINVSPAAATHLTVSAPSIATAGTAFNLTVTAIDAFGNTATGYPGTVRFTSTDTAPGVVLPANSKLTNGAATFPMTLITAGTQTVTATDTATSSITGTTSINVFPAAATRLIVSAPSSAKAGTAFNFTVTALDQFGNTATGYLGTVHFTSTDSAAALPADFTFTSGANGTGTFSATLNTAGNQTITATDTATSSITGASGTIGVATSTVNFGTVNICPAGQTTPAPCSQTMAVFYDVTASGTLGTAKVLTQGAPNLDFTLASSTCTGSVTAGASCTVNVTFAPRASGLRRGAVQITDAGGNVLATILVYGIGMGPQMAFGPGVQTTFASGPGTPHGSAVDAAGNVFIAETGNSSVVEVPAGGGSQTTAASGLSQPYGVAVDGAGNVFIADWGGQVVEAPAGGGAQTTIGSGWEHPAGIAVDGAGNVFVADAGLGQVVEVPAGGGAQTPVGSGLSTPSGVAVDGAGNVFIADAGLSQVVEVPAGGGTQTTVGSGLSAPHGVAVDGAGNVFIADSGLEQVVEVPAGGGAQTTVGSGLSAPYGVAVDGSGNVFIAEPGSNSVVEVQRSQPPSLSFANTPVNGTSSDSPQSVTVQNIGNATLSATGLAVGTNFEQVAGSGSPADCTSSFSLAPGASCNLSISFMPLTSGPLTGAAVLTDNALNLAGATQSIALAGTGLQLPQTITFNPIANQVQGTTLNLSATTTSPLTVSFTSLTTGVCTVSAAVATLTNPGTCTIKASQAGNGTYAAAQPVSQSFTVLTSQTITFNTIANQVQGTTLNLVATTTSPLTVSFASLTTGICTVSGTVATLSNPGTCTIQASQSGNATYAAAQPVSQSFTVLATQTITFNPIATQVQGTTLNLSATTTSPLTVSFTSLTTGVCTVSAAVATLTNPGTCTIKASQAGNGTYAAAQPVSQSFTVLTSQTITFNAIANQVQGTKLNLSASASSGLTVSFSSLTTGVCTVSGAIATLSGSGLCTIQATQPGNAVYAAAPPVSRSFTVSPPANFTMTPIPSPDTVYRGVLGGFILELQSVNGFNGNVTLSCAGGPAGAICEDLPQTVHVNGTAYGQPGVLFPKSTKPGTYTMTFTGVSGSLKNSVTAKFTVK